MKRSTGRRLLRWPLALAASLLSLSIYLSPWARASDAMLYDLLTWAFSPYEAPSEVAIVAIDEASFSAIQRQWPWPRSIHGELVDRLFEAGARAVVFDVVFSEPSFPEEDEAFAEAIRRHRGKVVLGAEHNKVDDPRFDHNILVRPLPLFEEAGAVVGYINLPIDDDGFVRRLSVGKEQERSLAQAALLAARREGEEPESTLISFAGPPRTIPTYSYYQALDSSNPLRNLADRIVLVGVATTIEVSAESGVRDHFLVPFSRFGSPQMAGVEIQANAVQTLNTGRTIVPVPRRFELVACAAISFLFGLLFLSLSPALGGGVLVALAIVLPFAHAQAFRGMLVYLSPIATLLPLVIAYLASPFFHYMHSWRERNFIKRAFSMYLAPSVVDRLLDEPDRLSPGGELIEGSVLFLDIVGFSSIAEKLQPQELVRLLNALLAELNATVFAERGMIDKFIGDSVMAVWGVPLPEPEHAKRAARTALKMLERVQQLNVVGTLLPGRDIAVRIGIASGQMVAGNIGDETYVNYTVLGTVVNIASRLEGLSKEYGTVILITEDTARALDDTFAVRELEPVVLRGSERATTVYELCGMTDELSAERRASIESFVRGRDQLKEGNYFEAVRSFEEALKACPGDGASKVFLERARRELRQRSV